MGDSEGLGSLACYSPWGYNESDVTWRLNNSKNGEKNIYASRECDKTW